MPSANLHEADFDAEWRTILGEEILQGYEKTKLISSVPILNEEQCITRQRALLRQLNNPTPSSETQTNILAPAVALRICALRCLFTELGILLHTSSEQAEPISKESLLEWQLSVTENPFNFIEIFRIGNRRPLVESLVEWWNWLTPTTVGRSPRYDSLFFLCVVDPWPVESSLDSVTKGSSPSTVVESSIKWNYLEEIFGSYNSRLYLISPPQLYELARLSSHPWIEWLRQFAEQRQTQHQIQRWIPSISIYNNGTISYLPGDQFYPPKIDDLPTKPPRMYGSSSLEDMRHKATSGRLNRIEHTGYWCQIIVANTPTIDHPGGHLPIFYGQLPVIKVPSDEKEGKKTAANSQMMTTTALYSKL